MPNVPPPDAFMALRLGVQEHLLAFIVHINASLANVFESSCPFFMIFVAIEFKIPDSQGIHRWPLLGKESPRPGAAGPPPSLDY